MHRIYNINSVNYGVGEIMICNVGLSVITNVPHWCEVLIVMEAANMGVGVGNTWKLSTPSAQFCCEPKTSIKIKSIKGKKIRRN